VIEPRPDAEPRVPKAVVDTKRTIVPARVPETNRTLVPARVPETKPTPLQDAFIYLSLIVLVCGAVAITALELGASPRDAVVKLPVLIGGVVLVIVAADAVVRIARSARAWQAVDANRARFRLVWIAAIVGGMALLARFAIPVLTA
jgi:hypothetical protein